MHINIKIVKMSTLDRDNIAHKLATLPPLPKDNQNYGGAYIRSCRKLKLYETPHLPYELRMLIQARSELMQSEENDTKTAIEKANEAVQKCKLEARRVENRLRRAQKRLEMLQPKDKHARVKKWLGVSDSEATTKPPVQEERPPFMDNGFPIPNQQWVSAGKAQPAPLPGTVKKDYYRVCGKRMPLTDEAVNRARAKRRRKREEAAKK